MPFHNNDVEEAFMQVTRCINVDCFDKKGKIIPEGSKGEESLKLLLQKSGLNVKFGIDPRTHDLHLGHLVPLIKLQQFQKLKHYPVIIIGTFTATIGDPEVKRLTIPSLEEIKINTDKIISLIDKLFLDAPYSKNVSIIRNGWWFDSENKLSLADFIRMANNVRLDKLKKRTSPKNPKIQNLLYPILQAYDSVRVESDIEIGGLDQELNIEVGRIVQKNLGSAPQIGICYPSLPGTDGNIMSHANDNIISIDEKPDKIFKRIIKLPEDCIWKYFYLLTHIPPEKIEIMKNEVSTNQKSLADVTVKLAHHILSIIFDEMTSNIVLEKYKKEIALKNPLATDLIEVENGGRAIDLIMYCLNSSHNDMHPSRNEIERQITQNSWKLDDETITDPLVEIEPKQNSILRGGRGGKKYIYHLKIKGRK